VRAARALLVFALSALALGAMPGAARAQGTAVIELPLEDPFPAAPVITVRTSGFPDGTSPRRIRLRLALDNSFQLVVYDSTISSDGAAQFGTRKLLPENRDIYAEATVINPLGQEIFRTFTFAGHTGPRLRLVSPRGVNVRSRTPTFSWRSAPVSLPPGPWVYELFVTNVATQVTRSQTGITDTVFVWRDSLDAQTSYRWKVIARLPSGFAIDSAVVSSVSSFVVSPTDAATATLLYQNFPNPFPAPSSPTTCFWFDLHAATPVELSVLDVRGHRVKTMIPGQLPSTLPAGRYGRLLEIEDSGCDPRLAWDGSADDGRVVPPGLYLLRMKTDDGVMIRKIVFRGR
jgi:hypothetical protein